MLFKVKVSAGSALAECHVSKASLSVRVQRLHLLDLILELLELIVDP